MRIESCGYDELPERLIYQARREGAEIDRTLKSPWRFYRAVIDDVTVGFVGVVVRSGVFVTLRGWYVAPRFRGQGIGTALLEAAMSDAIDQGIRQVEIRTNKDRIASRLGFAWTGYQRQGGNHERRYVREFEPQ